MDMKEKKMTVIGTVDPVTIVSKLRKYWPTTSLISVGPAKEPEKKEEPKKDGETPKKEEDAKKGGGEAKKDGAAGEAKKDEGEGKKDEGEAKKDEGEAKKEEGEAKKDGGGGGGEKKDAQPAAGQPHPIQLIPQFQHLPMPYPQSYPQPYPYPYPQPQSDPRIMELVKAYRAQAHNPQYTTHYHVQSMEENPNACVIC